MGALGAGVWNAEVHRALRDGTIAISPLELLGSAIALHIAEKAEKLPAGTRRIVLRNDNDSACTVINSRRATSAPMLEALRIFTKVRERLGLVVRMHHIPGKDNGTADDLSRGRRDEAVRDAAQRWQVSWISAPKEVEGWMKRIVRAGERAAALGGMKEEQLFKLLK